MKSCRESDHCRIDKFLQKKKREEKKDGQVYWCGFYVLVFFLSSFSLCLSVVLKFFQSIGLCLSFPRWIHCTLWMNSFFLFFSFGYPLVSMSIAWTWCGRICISLSLSLSLIHSCTISFRFLLPSFFLVGYSSWMTFLVPAVVNVFLFSVVVGVGRVD